MAPGDDRVVRVAKALGDGTRLRILREIATRGETCCRDLTSLFGFSQATVSHHLRILSDAGLVTVRREGQFSYFRPRPGAVEEHARALASAFARKEARRRRRSPAGARRGRAAP